MNKRKYKYRRFDADDMPEYVNEAIDDCVYGPCEFKIRDYRWSSVLYWDTAKYLASRAKMDYDEMNAYDIVYGWLFSQGVKEDEIVTIKV